MVDRLSELARQRALVSEHLTWLDREIADETVKRLVPNHPGASVSPAPIQPTSVATASLATTTPAAQSASPAAKSVSTPAAGAPDTAEILDQYRVAPSSVKQDVRKGCLLYFAAAFVVLALIVAILYFTIGTHGVE